MRPSPTLLVGALAVLAVPLACSRSEDPVPASELEKLPVFTARLPGTPPAEVVTSGGGGVGTPGETSTVAIGTWTFDGDRRPTDAEVLTEVREQGMVFTTLRCRDELFARGEVLVDGIPSAATLTLSDSDARLRVSASPQAGAEKTSLTQPPEEDRKVRGDCAPALIEAAWGP